MTAIARAWLPPGAVEQDVLALPLGRIVGSWSENWFAKGEASIAPLYQDDWPDAESTGWRSLEGASIALSAAGRWAVASALLGRSIAPHALQANDRLLIDRLTNECADDLVRRIMHVVSADGSAQRVRAMPIDLEDCSWWQVSLSGSRPLFRLATSRDAAVGLAKSQLPPPRLRPAERLTSGLACQDMNVSLDLGRCKINLAELESLGLGDVLMVGRSTEAPLELLLNETRSRLFAHVRTTEGGASLVIASKEDRNG